MILIITDKDEPTTDLVIDWILYFKKKFVRISKENIIDDITIYFDGTQFEAKFSYLRENKKYFLDTKCKVSPRC